MQKNTDIPTTSTACLGSHTDPMQLTELILRGLTNAFHASSILVLTPSGTVLYANNVAAAGLSGYSTDSVVGLKFLEITPRPWAEERLKHMQLAIQHQRPLTIIEILDGTRLSSTISPIKVDQNHPGDNSGDNSGWMLLVTVEQVTPLKLDWLRTHKDPEDLIHADVIDLGPLSVLSPRELEVIALMGQGLRQKQIAERLHRSVSTVDRHRERIGEKLGIADRIELVGLAREAVLEVEDAQRTHVNFQDYMKQSR